MTISLPPCAAGKEKLPVAGSVETVAYDPGPSPKTRPSSGFVGSATGSEGRLPLNRAEASWTGAKTGLSCRLPFTSRTRAITRPVISTKPRRAIVTLADPPAAGIVADTAPAFRITRPARVSGEVAWIRDVPIGTSASVKVPSPADLADEMSFRGGPVSQTSTAAFARGAPAWSTTVPVTVPSVELPGKIRFATELTPFWIVTSVDTDLPDEGRKAVTRTAPTGTPSSR